MNNDQNVESKENLNKIDVRESEGADEEEKNIDTFFKLIKNYQEARKRRREVLAESSSDVRKKLNGGETSGIVVPAFKPEDFSQYRKELMPPMTVSDQIKENVIEEEQEQEADKDKKRDIGLDLNLAL